MAEKYELPTDKFESARNALAASPLARVLGATSVRIKEISGATVIVTFIRDEYDEGRKAIQLLDFVMYTRDFMKLDGTLHVFEIEHLARLDQNDKVRFIQHGSEYIDPNKTHEPDTMRQYQDKYGRTGEEVLLSLADLLFRHGDAYSWMMAIINNIPIMHFEGRAIISYNGDNYVDFIRKVTKNPKVASGWLTFSTEAVRAMQCTYTSMAGRVYSAPEDHKVHMETAAKRLGDYLKGFCGDDGYTEWCELDGKIRIIASKSYKDSPRFILEATADFLVGVYLNYVIPTYKPGCEFNEDFFNRLAGSEFKLTIPEPTFILED